MEHLIDPVWLLIDTSSGPHGRILWLQLSNNIMLQLQFIFTILLQLSHLDSMKFIGLHNIKLLIKTQY